MLLTGFGFDAVENQFGFDIENLPVPENGK
jgi:hypothetical protein